MKYETYKYEKGTVKLEFSFPIDASLNQQKQDFKELLIKAVSELAMELQEHGSNGDDNIYE